MSAHFLLALALAAEEETAPEPVLTEEVEVRSELPGEEDVAAFATRLRASEIDERGQDLADVLRRVPGARVRDYGGLGSYATLSLRASTSEQVTVLVDGVPQNRAVGGPVDLSSIPATQVEQITVFRGFGPASYGLGGIGGVVDVRTRAPSGKAEPRVDAVAGQLGTLRLSSDVSLEAGEGNHVRIGAEWLRSEGDFEYYDTGETLFNRDDDAIRRRTNNDLEDRSALLQFARDRLGGGELRASARVARRERGAPGLGTASATSARAEETLDELTLAWTRRSPAAVLDSLDLVADGFRQEIALSDPAGEIGLGARDRQTALAGGGLASVLRARMGSHLGLLRLDLRREEAQVQDHAREPSDRGGAVRDLWAVTAEDVVTFRSVALAPSLRFEHRSDDFVAGASGTLPPPAPDAREDAWSGKLGASWAIRPDAALRGSVGHFHRSPSLLELFGDRGSIVGNPILRPEQGLAAEIGYSLAERSSRAWSGEIVAFGRRSEDLIHFLPVAQGTAVARNISRVSTYGLEAALSLRLGRRFTLDATGTLAETEDDSGGFSDGKPLPYQPQALGYVGVAYRRGGLRARWEITYTGGNSTDALDTPELRLPARVIHDLNLGWQFRGGVDVGIDVSNALDRTTRDLLRYPLPGRVLAVHLGWRPDAEKR